MKKAAKLTRKPKLQIVLVTAPPKEAELIARMLLEERLIACANLVPGVLSLYWWENAVCKDGETLIVMKTPSKNVKALFARLKELHSYKVPEFLTLPIDEGSADYVAWALSEAKPTGRKKRKAAK